MMTTRGRAMPLLLAAVMVSAGCATNGLASLPLPAPGLGSGGYSLNAVFSNALNLPMNAKVKLAGADVGQLESMIARNYTALTRLRIRDGVQLPPRQHRRIAHRDTAGRRVRRPEATGRR